MHDALTRLHRTKLVLSCLVLVVGGTALIALGAQFENEKVGWLWRVPFEEVGGILIGAGLLSVWLDHHLRQTQRAIDDLRLGQLLTEHASVMRDAVLEAFAADHKDLARVATPETLDQIIANSLALRLRDQQFASEVYADIRDQAITATERWYDASLSIELSALPMGRGVPSGNTPTSVTSPSGQLFTVTVRWEYTAIPKHAQRRFACVSDRDEYAELAYSAGDTSAWFLKKDHSLDASTPEAFELLRFAVNGEERTIRRSARKHGQTYTVDVGADHVKAGEPVTIAYTYKTVTAAHGHLLFFDIEQPTRDLRVDFDYTDCGIATVSTLDLVPSVRPTRIEGPLEDVPGDVIRVDIDGWIFPRSGVAFVWTLEREHQTGTAAARRRPA